MSLQSFYFRISITDLCNLSCFYCHKEGAQEIIGSELSIEAIELACKIAKEQGFTKFKLTGGEPTVRKDICKLIKCLVKLNLPDLSMITNGTKLNELAQSLWDAGLRRINVTLNTLDQHKFEKVQSKPNQIKIDDIVQGIIKAKEVGFKDIKINFVYYDDDSLIDMLKLLEFVKEYGLTLVVLPVLEKSVDYSLEYLYSLIEKLGIQKEELVVDKEGIRKRLIYLETGAKILLREDELSYISPYKFCENCNKKDACREGIFPIRLSAKGELIPCMATDEHRIMIKEYLENKDTLSVANAFMTIKNWMRDYA